MDVVYEAAPDLTTTHGREEHRLKASVRGGEMVIDDHVVELTNSA